MKEALLVMQRRCATVFLLSFSTQTAGQTEEVRPAVCMV
ncbi:secreted protein [gut metagenome]|uniref:Secreted protein n=1 Tax=gut metagenome TaxID=749906 RepID=J9GTT4_9ZZZZ